MPAKKKTPASAVELAPVVVVESAISERLQLKRLKSDAANADADKGPTLSTPRGRAKSKVKSSVETNEEEQDSPAETLEATNSKGRGGRRSAKKSEELPPIEETIKNIASEKSSNTRVMRSSAHTHSKRKESDLVEAESDSEDSHSPALETKKLKQKEKLQKVESKDKSPSEDQTLLCPDAESKEQMPTNIATEAKMQKIAIQTEAEELKCLSNKKITAAEAPVSAVAIMERSPVPFKQQIQYPTSDISTYAVNEKLSSDPKATPSSKIKPPLASNSKIKATPPNPFSGIKAIPSKPPIVDSAVSRAWVEDISAALQKSKTIQRAPMVWRNSSVSAVAEDVAAITFAGSFLEFSDAQYRSEMQAKHSSNVYWAGSDDEDLLWDPSDHYMNELCSATSIAMGEPSSSGEVSQTTHAKRYTVQQGDETTGVKFALSLWGIRTCSYLKTEIDRRKEEHRIRIEQEKLRQEQERIEKEQQRLEKERIQQMRKKQAQERRERELEKIRLEKEKEKLRLEKEKAEEQQRKEKELADQQKEKERLAARELERERFRLAQEQEKERQSKEKEKARAAKEQEMIRAANLSKSNGREVATDSAESKPTQLHIKKKETDSTEKSAQKKPSDLKSKRVASASTSSDSESEASGSKLAGKKKRKHTDKSKKSSHKHLNEGLHPKKTKYADEPDSKSSSNALKASADRNDQKRSKEKIDRNRSRSRSAERSQLHQKDSRNRPNWHHDSSSSWGFDRERDRAAGYRDDRDRDRDHYRDSYLNDSHPSDRRASNSQRYPDGPAERDNYRRPATDSDRHRWQQYDEYRDRGPPSNVDQFGRQDRRYEDQNYSRPGQDRGSRNYNDDRRR